MTKAFMQSPGPSPLAWDIFCMVIDNFGDIGVCWRLARQLADEHDARVRLWVDDLCAFRRICPDIDPQAVEQEHGGVQVRHWCADLPSVSPGDIVIEAFACHLPEAFVAAMAARRPSPVWINLEYLSAEDWVAEYHALPSPHPRLPLTKHFFFPGFNERMGGLLRERDLVARRDDFRSTPSMQTSFWQTLGFPPPDPQRLVISLFAYDKPALADLLTVWAAGDTPICCLVPTGNAPTALQSFAGSALHPGEALLRGNLELRIVPFVAQTDYDRVLWLCDINLVRGEDSFVRAQWAGRPLLWQIYPQADDAHLKKLEAFLALYAAGLSESAARTTNRLFMVWNSAANAGRITPTLWRDYLEALPELRRHAENWANQMSQQEDLGSQLVRFCRNKL
ncbi:MAG: elongation factor P maturation arginine rhamnosyltransferase EarP [Propionivibrio sp.]